MECLQWLPRPSEVGIAGAMLADSLVPSGFQQFKKFGGPAMENHTDRLQVTQSLGLNCIALSQASPNDVAALPVEEASELSGAGGVH